MQEYCVGTENYADVVKDSAKHQFDSSKSKIFSHSNSMCSIMLWKIATSLRTCLFQIYSQSGI